MLFVPECRDLNANGGVFQSTIEQLVKDKMPKKSGLWWFSWRRKDMDTSQVHRRMEAACAAGPPCHNHTHSLTMR